MCTSEFPDTAKGLSPTFGVYVSRKFLSMRKRVLLKHLMLAFSEKIRCSLGKVSRKFLELSFQKVLVCAEGKPYFSSKYCCVAMPKISQRTFSVFSKFCQARSSSRNFSLKFRKMKQFKGSSSVLQILKKKIVKKKLQ